MINSIVPLREICDFKYGKSLPGGNRLGGGISVYGSNGIVGRHDQALTAGPTIVVGRKGSYGEVNYSASACWPIDTTYYIDSTCTEADMRWLYHLLRTLGLNQLNRAAAVPGLNREDAYRKVVALPPLTEQRRTAALLDKAEELRAQRRAALALLDQLPQAIYLEMFGDPAINPKGWPLQTLDDITAFIRNGKSVKQDKEAGGLPISRIETIADGTVNPDKCGYAGLSKNDAKGYLLELGDILFSHINSFDHVGKVARYEGNPADLIHGMNLLCIRPNFEKADPQFMLASLRSTAFRGRLEPFINKAVNQASVSGSNLKAIDLPIPPVELQHQFAARVEAVHRAKSAQQAALNQVDALFAALQSSAFSGGRL